VSEDNSGKFKGTDKKGRYDQELAYDGDRCCRIKETVSKYNSYCAMGMIQFRQTPEVSCTINPPYYGIKLYPNFVNSNGVLIMDRPGQ
jgi:hypothetical protein